jgi:hypothetical protein
MPQCFGWHDCAFLLLSAPAEIALDGMPPRALHDAKLSSELPNDGVKRADGVDLCDKRWQRFGAFSSKSYLLPAAAMGHRPFELWKGLSRSLALRSARHVCLREYDPFLRAQIPRLESMQICPAACHAGPVRESVFLA